MHDIKKGAFRWTKGTPGTLQDLFKLSFCPWINYGRAAVEPPQVESEISRNMDEGRDEDDASVNEANHEKSDGDGDRSG